jgi:hypothetical protein
MISAKSTLIETGKACAGLHWAIVCGELLSNQRPVELELAKQLRVVRQSSASAMRTHERLSQ